jgi:hypothetical protein
MPFAIADCTYWWPAWATGSDYAQYDAFAPIGVTMFFVPAFLVSLVITFVVGRWVASGLEQRAAQPVHEEGSGPGPTGS